MTAGEFHWARGRSFRVSAQTFGEVVTALPDVDPETVVAEAARPDSRLHGLFPWDDALEAHEARVHTARAAVAALRVVRFDVDDDPQPLKVVFQALPDGGGEPSARYVHVRHEAALSDEELRARAVAEAVRRVRGVLRRYVEFVELKPLFDVLDEFDDDGGV